MLRLSTTSFVLSLIFGSYALHPLYASGPNASKSVHEMTEEEQLAQAIKNSQDTHQQGNERRARENRRQNETPSTPAITEEKQIEQAIANSIKTHEEGNKKRARENWQDIKKILKSSKDINELLKFDEVRSTKDAISENLKVIISDSLKGKLLRKNFNTELKNEASRGIANRLFKNVIDLNNFEDKSLFNELCFMLCDSLIRYDDINKRIFINK